MTVLESNTTYCMMAFSRSSKDISISRSVLTANCRDSDGSYNVSTLDLNNWIANIDGSLRWAEDGKFYDSSKNTSLTDDVTLEADCRNVHGSYVSSTLNLDEKIANVGGKLVPVVYERAMIKADGSNNEAVVRALKDYYDAHKDQVQAEVADGPGYKVLYVSADIGKDEGILMQVSANAEASVFHFVDENSKGGISTASFDVLQSKARLWVGAGTGVALSLNLIDAKASVFDLTLGVGADTGAGIEDDSLNIEFLGTGITVGRKVGISVLGNSVGIDFGRCTIA